MEYGCCRDEREFDESIHMGWFSLLLCVCSQIAEPLIGFGMFIPGMPVIQGR